MEKSFHEVANKAGFHYAVVERLDIIIALLQYLTGTSIEGEELEVEYEEDDEG